jgi:transposase
VKTILFSGLYRRGFTKPVYEPGWLLHSLVLTQKNGDGKLGRESFPRKGQDHARSARPTYTKEFKLEAVRLWQTSGKSQSQIARDLGVPDSTLSHWCLRFVEHGKDAFPGSGHLSSQEEEVRQLKRENEILRQERDVLKKLSASFRATQHNSSLQNTVRSILFGCSAMPWRYPRVAPLPGKCARSAHMREKMPALPQRFSRSTKSIAKSMAAPVSRRSSGSAGSPARASESCV